MLHFVSLTVTVILSLYSHMTTSPFLYNDYFCFDVDSGIEFNHIIRSISNFIFLSFKVLLCQFIRLLLFVKGSNASGSIFSQLCGPAKSFCFHIQHRALQQITCIPYILSTIRAIIASCRTCYCNIRFSERPCKLEYWVSVATLQLERLSMPWLFSQKMNPFYYTDLTCFISLVPSKVEQTQKSYSICIFLFGYKISVYLYWSHANQIRYLKFKIQH